MQNPKRHSIATKTLLHVAGWVSIVILLSTALAFWQFHSSTEALYLHQLEQFSQERLSRERQIFLLAESNLKLAQKRFVQRIEALSLQESLHQFDRIFQHQSDNSWRNKAPYTDMQEYAGNFIDDDTPLTNTIKKRAVIFFQIASQFGPAWHEQFANLYLIGKENYLTVYWPEVHWTQSVQTDIQLTQQPYYFRQKENNPSRNPQWTDVYFDQVAGHWLISAIAPLDLYGEQVGTVGQDLLLNSFLQRTLKQPYPGAISFIFSRTGHVIAHPELMEQIYAAEGKLLIQETANELLLQAYQKVMGDEVQLKQKQGSDGFYLITQHLPEADWFMVIAYPKSAVADRAWQDSQIVLELGALSLLAALVLVYLIVRRQVSRPLLSFVSATQDMSRGNNVLLPPQESEELQVLSDSFQAMQKAVRENLLQLHQEVDKKNEVQQELIHAHTALQEANDQLELRVLERTASLHAANEELSTLLDRLKATQQQLVESEKMSSLGGLVAGVAHEINTPIGICLTAATSLLDDLQLLKQSYHVGKMTETDFKSFLTLAEESLQMLVSNNQRASRLIQSFKQVAVDQSSEDKRHFLLKPYIQEILFSLQPKFKKTQHRLEIHCDEDIELESYPGAFSQVITNLVMNSLIHGFEYKTEGMISIEAHREDDQVCILYRDNGCGMSLEAVERVFDPFFTTKRGDGGSGLGCHLVYNLVTQQLNGYIHCSSELGQGVVFIIRIPSKL